MRIPEDIARTANIAIEEWKNGETGASMSAILCAALMDERQSATQKERERCLSFCNEYVENVELTGGTIKRFKLSDVNRIAKRAVRYVRDQINGTFDENWKPSSEDAA